MEILRILRIIYLIFINDTLYYWKSVLSKNRLYFENDIVVSKKNYWKLNDYGWEQIDPKFNMNKYMGVLDCGGDGECLFKCIAEALNHKVNPDKYIDFNNLRKLISNNKMFLSLKTNRKL